MPESGQACGRSQQKAAEGMLLGQKRPCDLVLLAGNSPLELPGKTLMILRLL